MCKRLTNVVGGLILYLVGGLILCLLVGVPAAAIILPALNVVEDPAAKAINTSQQEGYDAGRQGVPVEACPYKPGNLYYENWKKGWQRGYLERQGQEQRKQDKEGG